MVCFIEFVLLLAEKSVQQPWKLRVSIASFPLEEKLTKTNNYE